MNLELQSDPHRPAGLTLLAAATAALVLANLPWGERIQHLERMPIPIRVGPFSVETTIHFIVTDGLMTLFFLVIGLEIHREVREGELAQWKKAALPAAGALGGMLIPALLYALLNHRGQEAVGWAIPMATDIAFAAGTLAFLGNRVPYALRIFLLSLAVFDDLGAITIIGLFYSKPIVLSGLAWAALGGGMVALLKRLGAPSFVCITPGLLVWWGFEIAGIHPTLAGVVVGLLAPPRPLTGLESVVMFGIMPLFAFLNAGVNLGGLNMHTTGGLSITLGIIIGLFVGKPLGIVGGAYLASRLRIGALPQGVGWSHIGVAGCLGGIGFTMSLFIAMLAFEEEALLAFAKLGILLGSAASAIRGLQLGRSGLPRA